MKYVVFLHKKDSCENKIEREREKETETETETERQRAIRQSALVSCRASRIWFQTLVNIFAPRYEDWCQFSLP